MSPEQRDKAYLWDILDAALTIQQFIQGKTPHDYLTDKLLRSAVERQIEITGEAARHVSEEFKRGHPEIPWRWLVSQRNFLAHEYGEVLDEVIWTVATQRMPKLAALLRDLLPGERGTE